MKAIWSSILAAGMTATTFAQQPPVQPPPRATTGGAYTVTRDGKTVVVAQDVDLIGDYLNAVQTAETPTHWIGLGCGAATDALRAQLGLTDVGVLVFDVTEGSPAHTAGFQKHDVLTKAVVGEKEIPLKDWPDLIRAVKEADSKPFKLEGLRAGKAIALQVTPGERPRPAVGTFLMATQPPGVVVDPERVKEFMQKKDFDGLKSYIDQQNQAGPLGMRWHMTGPVVAAPLGVPVTTPLPAAKTLPPAPDNMTITVTRQGNEPAKIKVKIGPTNEWGATENELDTLPEDVRGHVQRMLQNLMGKSARSTAIRNVTTRYGKGGLAPTPNAPFTATMPPPTPAFPPPAFGNPADRTLQQQLERQQQQLDTLMKQLQAMQKSLEEQRVKN